MCIQGLCRLHLLPNILMSLQAVLLQVLHLSCSYNFLIYYSCGGVKAAFDGLQELYLTDWVSDIKGTLEENRNEIDKLDDETKKLDRLSELSVIKQVDRLAEIGIIKDAWARGQRLFVHGWIFDISTGELNSLKEIHPDDMIK